MLSFSDLNVWLCAWPLTYVWPPQHSGVNSSDTQVLVLYNVTEEESGEYICKVANYIGQANQSAWLNVIKHLQGNTRPLLQRFISAERGRHAQLDGGRDSVYQAFRWPRHFFPLRRFFFFFCGAVNDAMENPSRATGVLAFVYTGCFLLSIFVLHFALLIRVCFMPSEDCLRSLALQKRFSGTLRMCPSKFLQLAQGLILNLDPLRYCSAFIIQFYSVSFFLIELSQLQTLY